MATYLRPLQSLHSNHKTGKLYRIWSITNPPTPNGILTTIKLLSSSSSYRTASTDIPDPLSPLLLILHRLWQVFRATASS